jgi:hypothetical protein
VPTPTQNATTATTTSTASTATNVLTATPPATASPTASPTTASPWYGIAGYGITYDPHEEEYGQRADQARTETARKRPAAPTPGRPNTSTI